MANEVKHLQMTDGTIVDINTYIDLNNIYLDKTIAQSVPNIFNTILSLVGSSAVNAHKYNLFVTNYRKRINDTDVTSKASPVSALITLGETPTGEYTYIAYYIHIPGYIIAVYSDDTIVCNSIITSGDDHIVRWDVSITTEELHTIINKLRRGGTLIYYNVNTYFNIKPSYWLYVPSGSSPTPSTIADWFNDSTKVGALTIVYIYWSGASSKSEASVVFSRDNSGNISINVGAPHS